MKNKFELLVLKTKYEFDKEKEDFYRTKLQAIVKSDGIVSICLDSRTIFIEYQNKLIQQSDVIKLINETAIPVVALPEEIKENQIIKYQLLVSSYMSGN